MINLQKRLKLSIKILQEVKSFVQKEEFKKEIDESLESLNHYLETNNFEDFNEEEKQDLSILMFKDAISLCYSILENINVIQDEDINYMTKEEVKNKLIKEYMDALDKGNESIACLNIGEWIEKNNIEIINESSSNE